MDIAQSPPTYPIGPCTDDWLSANLNASLYLDVFPDTFKVSLVTLPFFLFFRFPYVFLLGLDVVLLGGVLLLACLVVVVLLPTCVIGGALGGFGSLMATPPLGSLVVYKKHIHSS